MFDRGGVSEVGRSSSNSILSISVDFGVLRHRIETACRSTDSRCLSQRMSLFPDFSHTADLDSIFLLQPNQSSTLPAILSHIPLSFPCSSLPTFNLTHHLFASTSSLLPTSNYPWPPVAFERPLLSFLTLSASESTASNRSTTFVTTSHPNPLPTDSPHPGPLPIYSPPDPTPGSTALEKLAILDKEANQKYSRETRQYEQKVTTLTNAALAFLKYSTSSITIPPSEAGDFIELVTLKMQPLWSVRGTEKIDNGMALSLRNDDWTLRIGELRQETRKSGVASSTSRGILCEVTWKGAPDGEDGAVPQDHQDITKAFLEQLLQDTGARLDGARSVMGYISSPSASTSEYEEIKKPNTNWALAELYAELLRTRG